MRRFTFHIALAAGLVLAAPAVPAKRETALDRYVQAPDAAYRWEVVKTIPGNGVTTVVVDMTSQKWRSAEEIDRPEWKHWLLIAKPDQVTSSTGMLWIGGGSNRDVAPDKIDPFYTSMAAATGTMVAELRMVPNQPLTFSDDKKPRTEDSYIAYTWDKFLRTGDELWPARLPMTKSAVRAMDTITAYAASTAGGGTKVERFVVGGGSKRGWTTWTTAAVDSRVVAIIPAVIDLLNVEKSFDHHYRAYGFYAPAVKDYQDMKIMDWAGTPQYRALMKIEEPYEYRERFTMPKLLINSAGDQFFLPDSSQFYFDDLPGEKHVRYVPNTDHSLRNSDARDSISAFYESIVRGTSRPRYSWKINKDGSIRVKSTDKPLAVKLWHASNPEKRDFRLMTLGPAYKSEDLNEQPGGNWTGRMPKPSTGWTAYFVELTYAGPGKQPLKVTSGINVIPDTLPSGPYKTDKSVMSTPSGGR